MTLDHDTDQTTAAGPGGADAAKPRRRSALPLVFGIGAFLVVGVVAIVVARAVTGDDGDESPARAQSPVTAPRPADDDPPLPAAGPAQGALDLTSAPGGEFVFTPDELTAETGVYDVNIDVASEGHTFTFLDPEVRSQLLTLNDVGTTVSGRVFFPHPGEYVFACTVPGHAGMRGVVKVTGPEITLDEAEAAADDAAG